MLKRVVHECEWSVKIHFRRACLYIDILTHATILCSLFSHMWLIIVAFSAIRQSSLFSSRQCSLCSDRSPIIVAFSVSNLFDSHQGSIFSDMSPIIVAFLVSSFFGSRQGSLFCNMSSVTVVFTVIYQWFVSKFKLATCSYNLKLVLTDVKY
jgi:hypothetical protein